MRFCGREKELEQLREIRGLSAEHSQFTVVTGRRRIGKTSLILKSAEGTRFIYLFVSRVTQQLLCQEMQDTLMAEGIEVIGQMSKFGEILKAVMLHSRLENVTLIIDEFQDFEYVDRTIFQDIQNVWDRYKDGTRTNLIVCGSVHSMMTRIFENDKEPLFGRPNFKIVLNPLPVSVMEKILGEHNPDFTSRDLLTLFMLTGGVPKYIEVLMDSNAANAESMLNAVASVGSIFLADGRDLMVAEFGKEYRTYFSIMQLISSGKEKRTEIEDVLGMEVGAYLKKLEEEYNLVKHFSPVFSKEGGRITRWVVSDMYLKFYFRFIRPATAYVESGRYDLILRSIESGIQEYEGRALEEFFRRRISEEDTYTEVGCYWTKNGEIEIDIAVIDDITKNIRFIEVKRNPKKLDLTELERKCETLQGKTAGYTVSYGGLSLDDVR